LKTYKEVQIGKPIPIGVGMMQTKLRYTYTKTKWGVLPILHVEKDVLTYRTFMGKEGQAVVEERSITTRELSHHIDEPLRKKILASLVTEGHAELTQL